MQYKLTELVDRYCILEPLDTIVHDLRDGGALTVFEAFDNPYGSVLPGESIITGGVAGEHRISDEDGEVDIRFRLEPKTKICESTQEFERLFQRLLFTMTSEPMERSVVDLAGSIGNPKTYRFFVCWLRDHVHVLKGMKYFEASLKGALELYRDTQREDGMIFDNCYPRTAWPNYRDMRLADGDYTRPFKDRSFEMKRIPVEADVEYLYVEGIYATWKATGDDGWMASFLESAEKAIGYVRTSNVRWSNKYKLVKRGYTIDTWDFQNSFDSVVAGDAMRIDPDKTRFGVMFGDNTGLAVAHDQLAEMYEALGNERAANEHSKRAKQIRIRLREVSWQEHFFRHFVAEDEKPKPELGVNESSQVSLSNAYSINRNLDPDQIQSIIGTYKAIYQAAPEGSPGEWYTIFPPFENGFSSHCDKWQYMNGSVTPIVAGELARGAMNAGHETYGIDILQRVGTLGEPDEPILHCSYVGATIEPPETKFAPIDLTGIVNASFRSDASVSIPWTSEEDNDLRALQPGTHDGFGVPLEVINPSENDGNAAVLLSSPGAYARSAEFDVDELIASLYLMHLVSKPGSANLAGTVTWCYEDGTESTQYVVVGESVLHWWMPEKPKGTGTRRADFVWTGANPKCLNVGVSMGYFDNPEPEKRVKSVRLDAAKDGAIWAVLAATVANQPGFIPPSEVSYGIPNGWGAAAVMYAMVEGLAGVVDTSTALHTTEVSPRWDLTEAEDAQVCICYPASQGYVSYQWTRAEDGQELLITTSGHDMTLRIPVEDDSARVFVNGTERDFEVELINEQNYAVFDFEEADLYGPTKVRVVFDD